MNLLLKMVLKNSFQLNNLKFWFFTKAIGVSSLEEALKSGKENVENTTENIIGLIYSVK
jgi:hypothetical protein